MRLPRAPLVVLAFLGAALPCLPASFVAPPALAVDAIDELLLKFDEVLKSEDEGKILAFIVELEGKPDARVTAKLAEVARTNKSDRVAIAAMAQAASRKSPDLLKWLKGKIEYDKWAEKHEDRHKAVLKALARYGDKSTLKALEESVKDAFTKNNAERAALSVAAYGSVRGEKAVVDQLIKWLEDCEKTGAGQGGKNPSKETLDTRNAAKYAILKTLEDLTLQAIGDAKTWQEWWDQNRKTFEFPDPNAPEVDVSTLTEFEDKAYGYTIKRSPDKGWTFLKADFEGGRVRLVFRDEQGFDWARIDAITWPATKDAPNVEALAKLWEKRWREGEFTDFAKGGEPVVEMKKFGGKEFWVASARGIGGGSWKNWEGCERRLYGHQLNPKLLLYFECIVRSGAEEPVKKALWAAVEGITFKR